MAGAAHDQDHGDAYRQWAALWCETYETDEEGEAAWKARKPLEDLIAAEPATCAADVSCKLKMLRAINADSTDWIHEDEFLDDVIGYVDRVAGGAASG